MSKFRDNLHLKFIRIKAPSQVVFDKEFIFEINYI